MNRVASRSPPLPEAATRNPAPARSSQREQPTGGSDARTQDAPKTIRSLRRWEIRQLDRQRFRPAEAAPGVPDPAADRARAAADHSGAARERRQAAADHQWGHIVPPDKLPQIANDDLSGRALRPGRARCCAILRPTVDDPDAMQQNIRYIEQLTGKPYDYATNGPPVAGPNTAKQANDWKVNQAGATAASTSLGQRPANRPPWRLCSAS